MNMEYTGTEARGGLLDVTETPAGWLCDVLITSDSAATMIEAPFDPGMLTSEIYLDGSTHFYTVRGPTLGPFATEEQSRRAGRAAVSDFWTP